MELMSKPSYSPEGSPLNQESDINDFILKNSILAYNGINEALANLEDKLKEGTRMSRREALTLLVTSFAVLLAACSPIQATEPTEVINDPTATSEIVSSPGEATPSAEVEAPGEMLSWRIVGEQGLSMNEVTADELEAFVNKTGLALWQAYEIHATEAEQQEDVVLAFTKVILGSDNEVLGSGQVFVKDSEASSWPEQPLTFKEVSLVEGEKPVLEQEVIEAYQGLIDQGLVSGVEKGSQLVDVEFVVGSSETGAEIQFQRLILEKDGSSYAAILMGVPDQTKTGVWYGIDTEGISDESLDLVELKVLVSADSDEDKPQLDSGATITLSDRVAEALRVRIESGEIQPALIMGEDRLIDLETGDELAWLDENGQWWLAGESAPTPTSESPLNSLTELIVQGNHKEAAELTQQAVEAGEFTSMNEAILEVWLPVIREQTDYSDVVIERLSPRFNSLEVNETGLAVIVDNEGNILIEKTVPGVSNVEWAIPITELAYGLDEEEKDLITSRFIKQYMEGLSFSLESNLYSFAVVINDVVQLEEPLELPDGVRVTTLVSCYYYDSSGNMQEVFVPYFATNLEERTAYSFGVGMADYFESRAEILEMMEILKEHAKLGKGPMTIEDMSATDYGQIYLLSFGMEANPKLASAARTFFQETVINYYDPESIKSFARDGDPAHLPQITVHEGQSVPLLIPLDDLGRNVYSDLQKKEK
jgi:hypothetical protein